MPAAPPKAVGPARIAGRLGVPASTVHKILVRNGLNRLSWIDRPTGRVIRRYERPEPGDLVHLDVKKVGKVPPGGGWRAHGRGNAAARGTRRRPRVGYSYPHVAIDDHSRLAYVEALDDETADTLCGFFERARIWFRSVGVAVDEIITDNGANFRSKKFAAQLARQAIAHTFCRPYRPQTNGKAERFNRTLADEFLYAYKFRSEPDRRRRLQTWVHHYNLHRHHTDVIMTLYTPEPVTEQTRPHYERTLDLHQRVGAGEDFPQAVKIQQSLSSGLVKETLVGRHEVALIHFHQALDQLLGRRG